MDAASDLLERFCLPYEAEVDSLKALLQDGNAT